VDKEEKKKPTMTPFSLGSLAEILSDADALLIVPPFQGLKLASLAVHLLQACGREAGFRVQVLYANILLASLIGEEAYGKICNSPGGWFAGERFFARSAYGLPPLGRRARRMFEPDWVIGPDKGWEIRYHANSGKRLTLGELRSMEACARGYVDTIARAVGERRYRIVGCTTIFQQTAASVALLSRIKTLNKDTITILGGANCLGEMARGIASLPSGIDYIFSGESEDTFPQFVRAIVAGVRPQSRILYGKPCGDLDALPTPSYVEFYEQRRRFLRLSKLPAGKTEIPYETSRGCWWGQRHPCAFCGLNGETLAFRQKSPERVISDLRALLDVHPTKKVIMTDCAMPRAYFQSLLPRLADECRRAEIFYEQRANLSLAEILALKRAGITSIQPGIESLSSRVLTLVSKGVLARQNLMLLRYARAVGLDLQWNLLWGFPGDDVEAYQETLAILPLLHHLQPPSGVLHLSIERFSPYYSRPADFGVRSIRPLAGYYNFLPKGADIERIAYHFTAKYLCGAHDHVDVVRKLWLGIGRWRAAWRDKGCAPNQDLKLLRKHGSYTLVDTRDFRSKKKLYPLDEPGATSVLTSRPYSGSRLETWALQEKLAVVADRWFVPLAVADPTILLKLTQERDRARFLLPQANATRAGNTPVAP
jgi:ribosomal peptide maturation radical SAM protein 1